MVEVENSTPEPDGTHKTYFLASTAADALGPGGSRLDIRVAARRVPAIDGDIGQATRRRWRGNRRPRPGPSARSIEPVEWRQVPTGDGAGRERGCDDSVLVRA